MSDVDLLVPPAAARAAQLLLRRLRFEAPLGGRRFGRNAHHLPIASRSQNGVTISVEIHRDALPRDTLSSISMTNLTEAARPFDLNGTRAFALGHVDTLRHLTQHLLEPSWNGRLRLIGLVDLLRYALTFNESIDWHRLETSYPFVINALRCLHYVIPLPAALDRYSPTPGAPAPARVGEAIRPLRAILAGQPVHQGAGRTVQPSRLVAARVLWRSPGPIAHRGAARSPPMACRALARAACLGLLTVDRATSYACRRSV